MWSKYQVYTDFVSKQHVGCLLIKFFSGSDWFHSLRVIWSGLCSIKAWSQNAYYKGHWDLTLLSDQP